MSVSLWGKGKDTGLYKARIQDFTLTCFVRNIFLKRFVFPFIFPVLFQIFCQLSLDDTEHIG